MLGQLDPAVVSRFVGDYFTRTVPDRPLPRKAADDLQLTEHDLVCLGANCLGAKAAPSEALDRLKRSSRGEPNGNKHKLPLARLAGLSIALSVIPGRASTIG